VLDPKGITLRSTPSLHQTSKLKTRIGEGELAKVVERRTVSGTTMLRLETPAGWAYDCQPGSRDKGVRMKEVQIESGSWHYRVCTPNGIALRSGCSFSDASKIGAGPREGALLAVMQRVQVNETAFLKLRDSAGWVFDQKGTKRMLEGPIHLEDLQGRPATVAAPGGAFLLSGPTKKSWAQTRRLLLQDAHVRVDLTGDLEGQSWVHVSQPGGMDGWLLRDAVAIPQDARRGEAAARFAAPVSRHPPRPPPSQQVKVWTEDPEDSTSASSRAS